MTKININYTVLKYWHDAAAGEVLNIGVVLYSPETGQAGIILSPRYSRLSEAFAGFEAKLYLDVTRRFKLALDNLGRHLGKGLYQMEEREKYSDAGALVRAAWPDQGMSYFAGPVLFGITDDFERELNDIYDRFVLSQQGRRETRHFVKRQIEEIKHLRTLVSGHALMEPLLAQHEDELRQEDQTSNRTIQ